MVPDPIYFDRFVAAPYAITEAVLKRFKQDDVMERLIGLAGEAEDV